MQIKASETIKIGALVSLATGVDGGTILLNWRYGCDAIGVAARSISEDEIIEYNAEKSSKDIIVKGSIGFSHTGTVTIKAACDLKAEDLVCLKQSTPGGEFLLDKWQLGAEAVGIAARRIGKDDMVEYCDGESTKDIHVKPH